VSNDGISKQLMADVKETAVANFRHYPGIMLDGLKKITKTLRFVEIPNQDLQNTKE
jgi:hypothetical protein